MMKCKKVIVSLCLLTLHSFLLADNQPTKKNKPVERLLYVLGGAALGICGHRLYQHYQKRHPSVHVSVSDPASVACLSATQNMATIGSPSISQIPTSVVIQIPSEQSNMPSVSVVAATTIQQPNVIAENSTRSQSPIITLLHRASASRKGSFIDSMHAIRDVKTSALRQSTELSTAAVSHHESDSASSSARPAAFEVSSPTTGISEQAPAMRSSQSDTISSRYKTIGRSSRSFDALDLQSMKQSRQTVLTEQDDYFIKVIHIILDMDDIDQSKLLSLLEAAENDNHPFLKSILEQLKELYEAEDDARTALFHNALSYVRPKMKRDVLNAAISQKEHKRLSRMFSESSVAEEEALSLGLNDAHYLSDAQESETDRIDLDSRTGYRPIERGSARSNSSTDEAAASATASAPSAAVLSLMSHGLQR